MGKRIQKNIGVKLKIQGVIFWIAIIAALILNWQVWHFNWMKFVGGLMIAIIAFGLILAVLFKIIRKKENQEKYAFILPDSLARAAKQIDMKTQLESSLIAQFFMLFGVTAFAVYYLFFTEATWQMKGFFAFNTVCGLLLLGSYLISSYSQYVSYCQAIDTVNSLMADNSDVIKSNSNNYKEVSK